MITFVGALLFSTKAVIVKKAFADTSIDALSLLTLRMLCSLPFYIFMLLYTSRRTNIPTLSTAQWIQIMVLGIFGYYLSSFLDFEGLQYISAGLERLILFLYPTFVVLINGIYLKQKIAAVQKWALALTYAGICIAYTSELYTDAHNPNFYWGSFLIFLCSVTFAFYIAGSGRLIPYTGASRFTAYAMLASTAGVFIHFVWRNNWQPLQHATGSVWLYGLLLAVVATVIPSFLISGGTKKIGSSNVAIISSIGPVSTVAQAHFILGEKISAAQITGTLLVIAGVLLISVKRKETVL